MRAAFAATLLAACAPPTFELTVLLPDQEPGVELQLLSDETVLGRWPAVGESVTIELPSPVGKVPADRYGQRSAELYAVRDDGVYVGASEEYFEWSPVTHIDGDEVDDFDRVRGWNVVEPGFSQGPLRVNTRTLAIPFDLLPAGSATVGGVTGGVPRDDHRVALFPARYLEGGPFPAALVADAPLVEGWTLSVAGEPPADHVHTVRGPDHFDLERTVEGALEVPLRYIDGDGDGAWSGGDLLQSPACGEEGTVALAWIPPATDADAAELAFDIGVGTGWHAVAVDDGVVVAVFEDPEAATITFSGECAWW